ncbi:hypothetical protein ACP70R_039055 [Stipagrostis hirtigluma subsp. patula]
MAAQQLAGVVAAIVVAVAALAVRAAGAGSTPAAAPPHSQMINPGRFNRNQDTACYDPMTKKRGCVAKCSRRCSDQCIVICPTCETYCICDFYPGMSCGDPRFTGGDGNNFYFHGRKDHDFCILTDAGLHINAHFIGKRNPAMRRDFTWIQALGIRFADHRLSIAAAKTAEWDSDVDHLDMAFDGERIDIPTESGARWESATAAGRLSVTRTTATNGVVVELEGVFDVMANVVPITEEDSRVHNYGVTEEDSLAHFDLGFKFHNLTDDVHGVLGQTYRSDYVNQLSVSSNMPVMGGAPKYVSSDIFAIDCAVARFGAHRPSISMVTAR